MGVSRVLIKETAFRALEAERVARYEKHYMNATRQVGGLWTLLRCAALATLPTALSVPVPVPVPVPVRACVRACVCACVCMRVCVLWSTQHLQGRAPCMQAVMWLARHRLKKLRRRVIPLQQARLSGHIWVALCCNMSYRFRDVPVRYYTAAPPPASSLFYARRRAKSGRRRIQATTDTQLGSRRAGERLDALLAEIEREGLLPKIPAHTLHAARQAQLQSRSREALEAQIDALADDSASPEHCLRQMVTTRDIRAETRDVHAASGLGARRCTCCARRSGSC